MTNHTDQYAREAREWAEHITSARELHGEHAPQARAAARFILDNTTPALPDPLFLARATHPEYGEGIVISRNPDDGGDVRFMFQGKATIDGTGVNWVPLSDLTFHTPDMSKNAAEIDTSTAHVDPIDTTPDHPLFLARATHPEHGEGIVTSHRPNADVRVRFLFQDEATGDGTQIRWLNHNTLTFHTPDHPEYLETEEDYANAPEGTIVAQNEGKPFMLRDELWRNQNPWRGNHSDMAGVRRRVLRWGWEA